MLKHYQDDSSGSSRSNLAAVVEAANALLEQHKQKDKKEQLEKDNQQQQQQQQQQLEDLAEAAAQAAAQNSSTDQQQQQQQNLLPTALARPLSTDDSPNKHNKNLASDTQSVASRQHEENNTALQDAKNKGKKRAADTNNNHDDDDAADEEEHNNYRHQHRHPLPPKVEKRLERNAREKERSTRINDQFNELKDLLSQSGIVVPKGTKGSVLSITHQYVLSLKVAQQQKEQDNCALRQQINAIAKGSMGPEAARAVFSAAQKQGLHLDQNVAPPGVLLSTNTTTAKAPLSCLSKPSKRSSSSSSPSNSPAFDPLTTVQDKDYPTVWNQCPTAMAMATLGGTFVDCNQVFCKLINCSRTEIRQLSIFHLLNNHTSNKGPNNSGCSKADLRYAFEQISQLLEKIKSGSSSSGSDDENESGKSSVSSLSSSTVAQVNLQGSVQGQDHLGLSISIISSNSKESGMTDSNNSIHHLCVTIMRRFKGPAGNTLMVPATLENATLTDNNITPSSQISSLSSSGAGVGTVSVAGGSDMGGMVATQKNQEANAAAAQTTPQYAVG